MLGRPSTLLRASPTGESEKGPNFGQAAKLESGVYGPLVGDPTAGQEPHDPGEASDPRKKVAPMMPEDRIDVFASMERKADGET